VISSGVLGFLILFNARAMCSSRRRLEFGICRISGSGLRLLKNELSLFLTGPRCQHEVGEAKALGKGKGCDIGYALATNSCEGANSVETCTVTALDAITAFAVPNPNSSSQSRRFFPVWLLFGLPRRADHSAYFGLAKV